MTDKEWEEFRAWWKSKYVSAPDRSSIEKYLEWSAGKFRQADFKWEKKQ